MCNKYRPHQLASFPCVLRQSARGGFCSLGCGLAQDRLTSEQTRASQRTSPDLDINAEMGQICLRVMVMNPESIEVTRPIRGMTTYLACSLDHCECANQCASLGQHTFCVSLRLSKWPPTSTRLPTVTRPISADSLQ